VPQEPAALERRERPSKGTDGRKFQWGAFHSVHPMQRKVLMFHPFARAAAVGFLLGWATPAAALECADFAALLDAQVPQEVIQDIVLASPPEDGWGCLADADHSVTELEMATAFRHQNSSRALSWQARFKQCEAGQGIRRRARRLLADEDAPAAEPIEPETVACRRAASLQVAIAAPPGA
jgi:hypothetical protein